MRAACQMAATATTMAEMDQAAALFADMLVMVGAEVVMALVAFGAPKLISAGRKAAGAVSDAVSAAARKLDDAARTRKTTSENSHRSASTSIDEHTVTAAQSEKAIEAAIEAKEILFRGDSRTLKELKEAGGFKPRDPKARLPIKELPGTATYHQYVSTTPRWKIASFHATRRGSDLNADAGRVYVLDKVDGIEVNKVLGTKHKYAWEEEIAVEGDIPFSKIRGFFEVDRIGKKGNYTLNPNYDPNRPKHE